jgi:probable aminopeptidase NPEPL1
LYGVGKAAVGQPAMVILTYTPNSTATKTATTSDSPAGATAAVGPTVWVGKGIVYDTGGLSIKTKVRECVALIKALHVQL